MKKQTSSLEISHFPVMLSEVIKLSNPHKGGIFLDCTFGGGGYSKALLEFPNTKVIGIDRDPSVIPYSKDLKKKFHNRFSFYNLKFSQIDRILKTDVDIIIFDLGLSSFQLNNFERGFSFKSQDELDMTMGITKISAQDVVNNLSEDQLKQL